MATSLAPSAWPAGYRQTVAAFPWETPADDLAEDDYTVPPSVEQLTSTVHNSLGLNYLRTWPTLYDGTLSPHGVPSWWTKKREVDVLIVGAGPAGLQVAVSLARQGVSFRIIDKQTTPLIAGRADGVQPRFLELLSTWGLATEVAEEGPLIERTSIYKDGQRLFFNTSHQSDSRYRGLHIITQGQIERIYARDLARHKVVVERGVGLSSFESVDEKTDSHPVHVRVKGTDGVEEEVRAKYMVGADGAGSLVRKGLGIDFDGTSTDIFWGILDAKFESDYPHAWVFGSVISSEHGGCVIIPREDGYIRLYTQLDVSSTGPIAQSRQGQTSDFSIEGGRVDVHSITADEVLAQANRIFAPYTLKFASTLSWFAVWKISERVARSFVSDNHRICLAGDAAHIHSVMGAFGLNASMMDSANLAWKLGLCARGIADHHTVLPTYDAERRLHAHRIIRVSGNYLRFICQSKCPLAEYNDHRLPGWPAMPEHIPYDLDIADPAAKRAEDARFLREFFGANGPFLLGIELDTAPTVLSPGPASSTAVEGVPTTQLTPAITPAPGVRAPNPRLMLSPTQSGYLYDKMTGASAIHVLVFASDLRSRRIRAALAPIAAMLLRPAGEAPATAMASSPAWFWRYGAGELFNLILVTKALPHEVESEGLLGGELLGLSSPLVQVMYDDRAPDEDAHVTYGVDHARGAVAVVRPDLIVGCSAPLEQWEGLGEYVGGWVRSVAERKAL